jgi:hypothetical protein
MQSLLSISKDYNRKAIASILGSLEPGDSYQKQQRINYIFLI